MLDDSTSLTVLRLATVHGRSPRQRLDSVVNRMAAQAAATGRIPLNGGSQRRPVVHVGDVAEVLAAVLAAPNGHQILNVGSDRENFTITQIAQTVAAAVPGSRIDHGPEQDETDSRDYRTSFARLATLFPGTCLTPLRDGVNQVAAAVTRKELGEPDLPEYDNVKGLLAARTAGLLRALRSADCERLHADYAAVARLPQ